VAVNLGWENYVADTDEWLAPEVLAQIRSGLSTIAEEVVGAIQSEVPEYARPLDGEFGSAIRTGTEVALRRFVGERRDASADDVYRRLGAGEYRAGRSLDALQSAYRIGARVAWRRLSDAAAAAGASSRAQRNLAEAMFAYIDRLAGESVEGYAEAQLSEAGDLGRRRSELAEALVAGVAAESEVARAAEVARWPLPRTVACLALAGEHAERAGRRLSGETLTLRLGETTGVVVPNPVSLEREAALLAERLGLIAGLGPTVPLGEARSSMQLAGRALELACAREPLAVAERCLAQIVVRSAPEVLAELRERLLAPLQGQTPASRARLEATLLQWLRHRGSQNAIAAELSIHPQTARYRIRRLRELMGGVLDDPEQRFALEMALRHGHEPG
jgi:hypothetical protein